MQIHVAEIENLQQRLKELCSLLMESNKGVRDRNHIESEIRAVNLLLSHYREVLAHKAVKQVDSNSHDKA